MLQSSAQALRAGAEDLKDRLTRLDGQVGGVLAGWRGESGGAYTRAWELWHRGAVEVQAGLSILLRLVDHAGRVYEQHEAASAEALGELSGGAPGGVPNG